MDTRARKLRSDALAIFRAALDAADAGKAVRAHLKRRGENLRAGELKLSLNQFGRVWLVAVGKAATAMALAVEEVLGATLSGGTVVTTRGHPPSGVRRCRVIEAGHPIPDAAGEQAAASVREMLSEFNARDLLIVCVSGGASALLSAPGFGVRLRDKQKITELLLRAGADIYELNAVRKHLSYLKGGQLAQWAYPATVVSLLLSDVVGDALDVIGSGLTAPDPSTYESALDVLLKYGLLEQVPASVRRYIQAGLAGELPETPKPGSPIFRSVHNVLVGSNRQALAAAAAKARFLGYGTCVLSSSMRGEAREVASVHCEILREVLATGQPVSVPACLLSGGETTVTVRGTGKGGRNQEFALAAALRIGELRNALVLSGGTDGMDGPTDAAGAISTGDTLERAEHKGLDPAAHLARNDSYPFFNALGDLVRTGPTGTNVMDVHILLAGAIGK